MQRMSELVHHWLAPVITVVFGIAALGFLSLTPAIDDARHVASRLALERASTVKSEFDHVLRLGGIELSFLADRLLLTAGNEASELSAFIGHSTIFKSIALVDSDGLERIRQDSELSRVQGVGPRVHFPEPYFSASLEGKQGMSAVIYGKQGLPVIAIAYPIEYNGVISAVLVADIILTDSITESVLTINNGAAYLVDSKGTIVAHPDTEVVIERRNLLTVPGVQKVLIAGEVTTGLDSDDAYKGTDGRTMFLAGIPIREGWGAFVEQEYTVALSGERKIELLSLAFSILGLIFFWFMWRRQRESERIIRKNVQLLTENQSSARLLIKKDRELNESNDRLERMNGELLESSRFLVRRDLELSEANGRLEELDAMKSEFVAVAAHQLRTPLTGVRWSLKALSVGEYGSLSKEQQKVTDDAFSAIVGAINLINDLLNVARIEGGRFGFSFIDQPIAPLIDRIIDSYAPSARTRSVGLIFDNQLPPGLGAYFDAEKLGMALDNIVDNAVTYTPKGGSVTVTASLASGLITITVADTGIGIPEDEQRRLFSKFFRAPNAILMQTSGTGLGLYLVRNIIEKHKGSINLTSVEGKGTTVTVTLPMSRMETR